MIPGGQANIAAHLPEMARQQPDTPAIHIPQRRGRKQLDYQQYSFRELDQLSNRYAHALAAYGIGRGVRTVLMVKPGLEFFCPDLCTVQSCRRAGVGRSWYGG